MYSINLMRVAGGDEAILCNLQKQGGAGSMQKKNGLVRPGKEKGLQIVLDRNFDR